MMIRIFWLMRVTGFAVIGLTALVSPPRSAGQQATQIACFSAVGACLLAWCAADALPRYRSRVLPAVFGVMAVAGGVAAATSGSGQTLIVFACVAAGWAGSETDLRTTIAVAAAGIVPIWIAGAFTGSGFGTMLGEPTIIAVCALFGLNRRSYRVQAEQAAVLLAERERLEAEQRRGDVLDERARIAREIHDVLAHSLGALGIQIQAAKALLTDHGDVDRAVEALSTAQRMAADGLTETRRAVHALRVDTLPLDEELAVVMETHRKRYHVPVTLETSGTPRTLPPDAALALLRAAQEAMVNAAKHAPGQPVAVRLDYGADDVRLSVVNDLDAAQPPGPGGGYGLTGMRERLRLLDGTLLAGPRENEWAVTAEIPLAGAADRIAK
ncbi:MAG TPA: histidine kinase [Trebonia sp.]|nr:histidine kinase [Trebonia sp.]